MDREVDGLGLGPMMPPARNAERRGRGGADGVVPGRLGALVVCDVERVAEDCCPATRAAGVEGLRGAMPSTRCTMYGGGTEYGNNAGVDPLRWGSGG